MRTVTIEMSDEAFEGLSTLAGRRRTTPEAYLGAIAESMRGGVGFHLPGPAVDPWGRTPEELAEDRARIMARSRPGTPPPPGKTLQDVWDELCRKADAEAAANGTAPHGPAGVA